MRYIEASRKIKLSKKTTTEAQVKKALQERLAGGLKVNDWKNSKSGAHFVAKTGGCGGIIHHARMEIDVKVAKSADTMRIIACGHARVAKSLLVSYTALFLLVLLAGLLPGSIETGGESSTASDALVFIIFGIFIFYDINQKLAEPGRHLEAALKSLDVEFG